MYRIGGDRPLLLVLLLLVPLISAIHINLKLGYLSTDSVPLGGPPMAYAIEKFLNQTIDSNNTYNISYTVRGPAMTPSTGVPAILQLRDDRVDAYIGPLRSPVCEAGGFSVTYWDKPFFPEVCSDLALADKTIFPTLVRVSPSYQKTGDAFVELFAQYGWSNTFMITSQGFCELGGWSIYRRLVENNITVAEWIRTPDGGGLSDQHIHQYLDRIQARARVIIICDTTLVRRRIMYAAQDLGMTGPDYVFLYYWLLPDADIYRPWDQMPSFEKQVPPNWASPEEEAYRKTAFYSYKQVTVAHMLQDRLTKERDKYKDISTREPWRMSDAVLKKIHAYYLYAEDATFAYLLSLDRAVSKGLNHSSGRVIFEQAKNIQFEGATGKVVIDSNGDRDPEYWVWSYGPGNTQFEPYAEIQLTGENKREVHQLKAAYWGTPDNTPPPDIPPCGYTGKLCPQDRTNEIVGIAVGVSGFVVLLFLFGFYRRNKRKREQEQEIQKMLWRINYGDLNFNHRGAQGSGGFGFGSMALSQNSGSVPLSGAAEGHQQFCDVAIFRGTMVAVSRRGHKTVSLTHDDLVQLNELKMMNHGNINQFVGACIDEPNVCVLGVYCSKGSIQDILQDDDIKLDWMFKVSLITDIINGMIFIQKTTLECHGNLTSGKCLVDSRWVVKISMDHPALRRPSAPKSVAGDNEYGRYWQLLWRAPELLRAAATSASSAPALVSGTRSGDVYSFGIILQEIVYRALPYFNILEPIDIIERVMASEQKCYRPSLPDSVDEASDQIRDVTMLMQACWAEQQEARPTFADIKINIKAINKGKSVNILDNMLHMLEKYANNLEDIVRQRTAALIEEKKKTDMLLYQMLPRTVAEKLKIGQSVEAEIFDRVTIYFSDIVGFTSLSSESTPIEVIELLNDLYTTFDGTISKHDVYKVETIGDAYMVVSGLPQRNGDRHVQEICNMALDLLDMVSKFAIRHRPRERLRIRIGIHSGSCAAGVVGLKMPRYCLFGDTVNMASRMESTGEVWALNRFHQKTEQDLDTLRIHLSEFANSMLTQYPGYLTEPRGETFVKGKGNITTYWLVGKLQS